MAGNGRRTGVAILSGFLLAGGLCRAEEAGVRATIDRPAMLVATPRPSAAPGDAPAQIVVEVVGYSPASDGPVQAVVTMRDGGRAIGHVSIFPRTAFDASKPEKTQRFAFPLPDGVAANTPLSLTVTVKPSAGTGKGASFVFGGARIE